MLFRFFTLMLFVTLVAGTHSAAAQKRPVLLNHIAITVKDLARSTAFYTNILQLQPIPEPFKDNKHSWFKVGEHSQLHVIEGEGDITHFKGNHMCFSIHSMDNFISLLKKNNIPFESWPGKQGEVTVRPDGVKQIYIRDPDGYWLEINDDQF